MWATCIYRRKLCTAVFHLPNWYFNTCLSRFCGFKSLLKTCQNKLLMKPYTSSQKKDWNRPVWSLYLQNDLANGSRGHQLLDGCCSGLSVTFPLMFSFFSDVCFWYNWISSVHTCKGKNSYYFFHGVRKTLWKKKHLLGFTYVLPQSISPLLSQVLQGYCNTSNKQ